MDKKDFSPNLKEIKSSITPKEDVKYVALVLVTKDSKPIILFLTQEEEKLK